MGADFLWGYVPAFNPSTARLNCLKRLANVAIPGANDMLDFDLDTDDPKDPTVIEAWRKCVCEAIDSLRSVFEGRETDIAHLDGMTYKIAITGGMSWGDTPGEAYATMSRLNECNPVFNQMKTWAIEDYLAELSKCRVDVGPRIDAILAEIAIESRRTWETKVGRKLSMEEYDVLLDVLTSFFNDKVK